MKSIPLYILLVGLIIAGGIYFGRKDDNNLPLNNQNTYSSNVNIIDGKQVIEINTKGGYYPAKSIAKAGIPTVLRFNTNSTFDCSAALIIPSKKINKLLPQTGITDIDLGILNIETLRGSCSMGMYRFSVDFK